MERGAGALKKQPWQQAAAYHAGDTFNRVFVERGEKVYFRYRNVDNVPRSTLRLTLLAADAVLTMLGTAAIVP